MLVSLTNGNLGHHEMDPAALAKRRAAEAQAAAERGGLEHLVLNHNDGELEPSLEARRELVSIMRRFEADVVLTHRPNDYHPDHRYTSLLVQDSLYMVTVPHFCPTAPPLQKNPICLYFMDGFTKPNPFEAHIAVAVDEAMETKWAMLDAMESQVYEWLPWHDGTLDSVPSDSGKRLQWLKQTWDPLFRGAAKGAITGLNERYGTSQASEIVYAELFEIAEHGRRPSRSEIENLFPFASRRT